MRMLWTVEYNVQEERVWFDKIYLFKIKISWNEYNKFNLFILKL